MPPNARVPVPSQHTRHGSAHAGAGGRGVAGVGMVAKSGRAVAVATPGEPESISIPVLPGSGGGDFKIRGGASIGMLAKSKRADHLGSCDRES